ncbi:DUF2752 domain-containing protein [Frankia sp. Cppng1_Ct_nod]|uniref:DUF2752 domain-containing protein n=1 Tax=Frankia sp. Cppng1_Ct_nod TaxID=2897162 RepID=UPI001040EC19|nr:DUF2752 domain-containing protein [Frankia sp. Cppng1_Ct_nod]
MADTRGGVDGPPTAGRTRAVLVVGGLSVAAAATRVFLVDPATPGRYPRCPFNVITGLPCPGCGTLRAAHDLFHGHVVAAADHNLLFVSAVPVMLAWWLVALARTFGCLPRGLPEGWSRIAGLIPLTIIVFWVLRLLPGPTGWLGP